jgi:hypothetical protein
MQYELILRNDKIKTYTRFALFLFLLNGGSVIFFLSTQLNLWSVTQSIFTGGVLLLLIITCYLMIADKKSWLFAFYCSVPAIFLFWTLASYWWIGMLMLLLFFLFKISDRQLIVRVTGLKVEYPSFPKREIFWEELSNLILKDGLLTIDFKNNRIIQQAVIAESKHINEKEFNEFCREQLDK